MLGFFGKSDFDSEMAELDKKHKAIGNEILIAMNLFQTQSQTEIIQLLDKFL